MIWLERLLQDIVYGIRNLRRTPGLVAITVASLPVGIMATTGIYSVVHAVVLDAMCCGEPQRLSGRGNCFTLKLSSRSELAGVTRTGPIVNRPASD